MYLAMVGGLLQTTEGKDEQNIVFMREAQRTSQHGTQNVKTHIRTTQKVLFEQTYYIIKKDIACVTSQSFPKWAN